MILSLAKDWRIQSSAQVAQPGDKLSSTAFDAHSWYPATVPTTVLAALVKDGKYPDPYFGMNLRSIPGTTYPIAAEFSNLSMSSDSPFSVSWWYRTEFSLPANDNGKSVWLHLDGLNYRANVWLNGRQVATSGQIAGAWRLYEHNVTQSISPSGTNVFAMGVFPPRVLVMVFDFVDWNPAPPDKDMGLWIRAYLTTSGPVELRHPFVLTNLDLPSLKTAHLTVTADVRNSTRETGRGTLEGRIEDLHFSQDVELAPGESKEVTFTPASFPQLNISDPHLWWPAQMGTPYLYSLELQFKVNDATSDQLQMQFGIREVTSEIDKQD